MTTETELSVGELRVESQANPNQNNTRNGPLGVCSQAHAFMVQKAREVAEFCLREGGQCFKDWPAPLIFTYALYHLVDRTCFVLRANGGIAAVMFAWGSDEAGIRARHAAGEPAFAWTRSQDRGDAIFLAEVVAPGRPAGDSGPYPLGHHNRNLARMFKMAASRWPDWQRKKIFTYRDSELVQISPELLKRMIYGTQGTASIPVKLQEANGR